MKLTKGRISKAHRKKNETQKKAHTKKKHSLKQVWQECAYLLTCMHYLNSRRTFL